MAAADVPPLVAKVRALGLRETRLRGETQRAQAGEALTRVRLGEALAVALAARSRAEAAARDALYARYLIAAARWRRPARRNRLRRIIERLLARGGPWGQALVIAWSGVWRVPGEGLRATLAALPQMAAYARRRADPAAAPATLFDQADYLAANADVARQGLSPLVHYLTRGGFEGRSAHRLLDVHSYPRRAAQALAETGLTPLEHFLRLGAAEGVDPHPLFDLAHYVAQVPELAETGENPLAHYLRVGARRDLSPHLLFQPRYYRRQVADLLADGDPLSHYLTRGSPLGHRPHPLFDPAWYRDRHPQAADSEPLSHFTALAGRESLEPGPWFDAERYKAARGADRPTGLDPLSDYLRGGAWAVAEPRAGFHALAYLVSHPELAESGLTPLEHWAAQRD
jgi:hypothetical protein